jgi:hypothetical protein
MSCSCVVAKRDDSDSVHHCTVLYSYVIVSLSAGGASSYPWPGCRRRPSFLKGLDRIGYR